MTLPSYGAGSGKAGDPVNLHTLADSVASQVACVLIPSSLLELCAAPESHSELLAGNHPRSVEAMLPFEAARTPAGIFCLLANLFWHRSQALDVQASGVCPSTNELQSQRILPNAK